MQKHNKSSIQYHKCFIQPLHKSSEVIKNNFVWGTEGEKVIHWKMWYPPYSSPELFLRVYNRSGKSDSWTHSFESDLLNEPVNSVHRIGLNDWLDMKGTDPVIVTEWSFCCGSQPAWVKIMS